MPKTDKNSPVSKTVKNESNSPKGNFNVPSPKSPKNRPATPKETNRATSPLVTGNKKDKDKRLADSSKKGIQ